VVRLTGPILLRGGLLPWAEVTRALEYEPAPTSVRVDASEVGPWDTALVAFLVRLHDSCAARQVALDTERVPAAARRMLAMARQDEIGGSAGSVAQDATIAAQLAAWALWAPLTAGAAGLRIGPPTVRPETLVDAIGSWSIHWGRQLDEKVDFLGATVMAVVRRLLGRARRLRVRSHVFLLHAGVETLPVVALMGFAMGVVLAIIATGQFQKVGAIGLVARVVSIAILREMGSLMVGVAIAGRLGSAIAAEIATMVSNDETDVLDVVGIDPFDFVVAPRVLATAVAGVLLVLYANAFALLGGLFAGVTQAGLSAPAYIDRTLEVLTYEHLVAGLVKGLAFGTLTALVACYHGLRGGRGAGAVGQTVRRSVVGAVVGVVLADVAITLIFKWVDL
jgi:phospholipid/cholesterol/gamma-HCH transport system permease protein